MRTTRVFHRFIAAIITLLLLVSCSSPIKDLFLPEHPSQQPLAEVLFRVKVLQPIPENATLVLELLDDVTGLYFNSSRFELSGEDALNYSIRVPLPVFADIKYRYVLVSDGSSYEFNSQNQQVRFRIARINGPEIIDDQIAAWVDIPYRGPAGRISGQVLDSDTNAPIPNLLITAGGLQAFTSSDGSFMLTDLLPGLQNLVIYSMDGVYETFQQGAVIAEDASTPVQVTLTPRKTTQATFEVTLPPGVDKSLPLRLVSNLFPLGNAYADLAAGSAGSAVNYPVMTRTGANRYTITLDLPVGLHLRYKYSLGDGFWNAELSQAGEFVVRDLIVTENLHKTDRVSTFTTKGVKPVSMLVQAPADTPSNETVFIQFNPFGWMEPLPMVSAGINLWQFTIYSPLNYFETIVYRYCRNGICGVAPERPDTNRIIVPGTKTQTLSDVIFAWQDIAPYTIETTQFLLLESVQPRPNFIAGVELATGKPSTWRYSIDDGLQYAAGIGGDWVVLTPTWTFKAITSLPEFTPSPEQDLMWTELMNQNSHVMMSGQKTILFPMLYYAQLGNNYEISGADEDWQSTFREQYERFIFHNADLAQLLGIEGLIIGTSSPIIGPNSGFKAFPIVDLQWESIISGIRQRYSGRVIGVVSLDSGVSPVPEWLNQVDIIYAIYSPPIFSADLSVSEIRKQIDSSLWEQLRPLYNQFSKPVLLGFNYDSKNVNGDVNLEMQAKAYSAAVLSVASQDWISGFISRGYYPYVELQDNSSTIYRKPAAEILWFWFHYLLNKAPN